MRAVLAGGGGRKANSVGRARCQYLSVTETPVGGRPQSHSLKHGRVGQRDHEPFAGQTVESPVLRTLSASVAHITAPEVLVLE